MFQVSTCPATVSSLGSPAQAPGGGWGARAGKPSSFALEESTRGPLHIGETGHRNEESFMSRTISRITSVTSAQGLVRRRDGGIVVGPM